MSGAAADADDNRPTWHRMWMVIYVEGQISVFGTMEKDLEKHMVIHTKPCIIGAVSGSTKVMQKSRNPHTLEWHFY